MVILPVRSAHLAAGARLEGHELDAAAGGPGQRQAVPAVLGPGLPALIDHNVGPEAVHGQLLSEPGVQIGQGGLHAPRLCDLAYCVLQVHTM